MGRGGEGLGREDRLSYLQELAAFACRTRLADLPAKVLERTRWVVADSLPQCRRIGEIHHALVAGVLDEASVTELGQIVSGAAPGRRSNGERIVCDLTGVGVQDVAAAALVLERARRERAGER